MMLIVIPSKTANLGNIKQALQGLGLWTKTFHRVSDGSVGFMIVPPSRPVAEETLAQIPGVADVYTETSSHPLVDAANGKPATFANISIGDGEVPVLMAGPCAVESELQIRHAARLVAAAGGRVLRGGAFKPRSSPYSFSGHGHTALRWMREAADEYGLAVVTEVMSETDMDTIAEAADILQIGSRNMQNFHLLRAVGSAQLPVLLKRGRSATIDEWLLAGEYLFSAGCPSVLFCERGVQGFDPSTRNLADVSAVSLLSNVYKLPVVFDPSHAAGRRDLILPLSRAALGAGAHALIVEVHPDASSALSDGPQAIGELELSRIAQLGFNFVGQDSLAAVGGQQ